ncbi:hypothetical protein KQ944_13165 [Bacillus subtilis]|uniref:hypothetical protein n=1 Tax=Pseudochrobactrum asaccharolyticum TaxID=354351 RepID=UPI001F1C88AD|nr:hypothetical protein [Pseudochrobactrum asaccharolyticum]MCF7647342.1 hypothetical protein [Pseudochrobactrum asaccharolyticum]MCF7672582.1 hypothetical protein [Bacillus subtilis]
MNKTEDEFIAYPSLPQPEKDLSGEERLKTAIRQAKTAQADRLDSISDIRETDIVRLELLLQDLQPFFDAVPATDEQWDFCLNKGMQPRLWLDASAFIMIGRDRRSYRFVRDTRLGRVVLSENKDIKVISDAVTRYIASRILERERLMDDLSFQSVEQAGQQAVLSEPVVEMHVAAEPVKNALPAKLSWFAGGALLGSLVLIAILRLYGVTLPFLWEAMPH